MSSIFYCYLLNKLLIYTSYLLLIQVPLTILLLREIIILQLYHQGSFPIIVNIQLTIFFFIPFFFYLYHYIELPYTFNKCYLYSLIENFLLSFIGILIGSGHTISSSGELNSLTYLCLIAYSTVNRYLGLNQSSLMQNLQKITFSSYLSNLLKLLRNFMKNFFFSKH